MNTGFPQAGPGRRIFLDEGTANKIGRITPEGRVTNEYPILHPI